jgi:hypothetical protein
VPTQSQVLRDLHPEDVPETACKSCVGAIWIHGDELRCYCKPMHLISYASSSPSTILDCDGQRLAESELEGHS